MIICILIIPNASFRWLRSRGVAAINWACQDISENSPEFVPVLFFDAVSILMSLIRVRWALIVIETFSSWAVLDTRWCDMFLADATVYNWLIAKVFLNLHLAKSVRCSNPWGRSDCWTLLPQLIGGSPDGPVESNLVLFVLFIIVLIVLINNIFICLCRGRAGSFDNGHKSWKKKTLTRPGFASFRNWGQLLLHVPLLFGNFVVEHFRLLPRQQRRRCSRMVLYCSSLGGY